MNCLQCGKIMITTRVHLDGGWTHIRLCERGHITYIDDSYEWGGTNSDVLAVNYQNQSVGSKFDKP